VPKKEKRDRRGGEAYSHHRKGLATEKLVEALFMDVKEAFNYVARKQLLKKIIQLKIPGDLIQ
jgi:hypothetical protein